MTIKIRQWRESDLPRLKSVHWVATKTGDNKALSPSPV